MFSSGAPNHFLVSVISCVFVQLNTRLWNNCLLGAGPDRSYRALPELHLGFSLIGCLNWLCGKIAASATSQQQMLFIRFCPECIFDRDSARIDFHARLLDGKRSKTKKVNEVICEVHIVKVYLLSRTELKKPIDHILGQHIEPIMKFYKENFGWFLKVFIISDCPVSKPPTITLISLHVSDTLSGVAHQSDGTAVELHLCRDLTLSHLCDCHISFL